MTTIINNKLTDDRTIGARIAALLVADSVPLSDAWKALIDDAERAELQERRKADSETVGTPDAWLWKKKTGYITAGINRPMYEPLHSAAIPLYAVPQPAPESEAQATLNRLAVILHGSEVDLNLLTVTAQSLMDRCKAATSSDL